MNPTESFGQLFESFKVRNGDRADGTHDDALTLTKNPVALCTAVGIHYGTNRTG